MWNGVGWGHEAHRARRVGRLCGGPQLGLRVQALGGATFPPSSPALPFADPQGPHLGVGSWPQGARGLGPEEFLGSWASLSLAPPSSGCAPLGGLPASAGLS